MLEKLSPSDRFDAIRGVLLATKGLLILSDSKTRHLREQQRAELPGKLPILLVAMAAHRAEILSIRYFHVEPDGSLAYYSPGESAGKRARGGHFAPLDARWSHFELAFRLPGDPTVRIMQHAVVNLHNPKFLSARYAHYRKWLDSLGRFAFMTKAATYLLWSPDFSGIRRFVVERADFMLSDASGVPPKYLEPERWTVTPYGRFSCDLLDWHKKGGHWKRTNDQLRSFFRAHSKQKLAFRFGYVDCLNRPSLLIAERRTNPRSDVGHEQ